jgi:formylglycine-generating enzyme required for sulfatase activity
MSVEVPGADRPILIENAKDGSLLVRVPAGSFKAGDWSSGTVGEPPRTGAAAPSAGQWEEQLRRLLEGGSPGTPAPDRPRENHQPRVETELCAFYLGIHPVTNAQFARFLSEALPPKTSPERFLLWKKYERIRLRPTGFEAAEPWAGHPVAGVSRLGANAYCEWAGLRLPTNLEWEKGARGIDGRQYPWGNAWDASKCRNSSNAAGEGTSGVWDYAVGCSPWGHYHMAGNVLEYCADANDPAVGNPQAGPTSLRGGSWAQGVLQPDSFRVDYLWQSPVLFRQDECGFRVARDA